MVDDLLNLQDWMTSGSLEVSKWGVTQFVQAISGKVADSRTAEIDVTVAGEAPVTINVTDLALLERTLESAGVQSLVQAYCATVLLADGEASTSLIDSLQTTFAARIRTLGRGTSWEQSGAELWVLLTSRLEDVLNLDHLRDNLDVSHRVFLESRLGTLSLDGGGKARLPYFLLRMLDMASDPDRLTRADTLGWQIREAARIATGELRLQHTLEDARREITDLYIDRDVEDMLGVRHSANGVLRESAAQRAVVIGPPGVGKSTLTTYMLHSASDPSDQLAPVPLLLRARQYNPEGDGSIVSALAATLRRDRQLAEVTEETLLDILCAGKAFVVFDGVDEILSLPARQDFVTRVEAFVSQYPLSSYLATARDIGYEKSQFSTKVFTQYHLVPFSDEQVTEYAQRWFTGLDNAEEDLAERFIVDVSAMPDLKTNPLMLSLLCALYRARGHLPRNRRDVYSQCADLLFYRWDSHRQIEQPTDYMQHGQDLMQKIAIWFFKSAAAQRGIQEQQLRHVIASFLRDDAGVYPRAADRRAQEFLDFCAERAWLLANAGVDDTGARVFVFTHRTFMEYFAAEQMSRQDFDPINMAQIIVARYREDASSVLPELIMQALIAHKGRSIARPLLEAIQSADQSFGNRRGAGLLALRLRLISATAIPPYLSDGVLQACLDALPSEDATPELFLTLLRLPRDLRARLEVMLGSAPQDEEVSIGSPAAVDRHATAFVTWWGYLQMSGAEGPYVREWSATIESLMTRPAINASLAEDTLARQWLISFRGTELEFQQTDFALAGFTSATSDPVRGSLIWALERLARAAARPVDQRLVDDFARGLRRYRVDPHEGSCLIDATRHDGLRLIPTFARNELGRAGEVSLAVLACLVWELGNIEGHALVRDARRLTGIDFKRLGVTRERENFLGDEVEPYTLREMRSLKRRFGNWIELWVEGKQRFALPYGC